MLQPHSMRTLIRFALGITAMWAFTAGAVQAQTTPTPRPGCLSGTPNGTYQGDRPVTRNEFAAGTNECLDRVNRLLPNREGLATRQDFQQLIDRQVELNREIRQLNDRVGNMLGDDDPAKKPQPTP